MREHARAQVQRANTLGGRSASRACNRGHYRRPDGAELSAARRRRSPSVGRASEPAPPEPARTRTRTPALTCDFAPAGGSGGAVLAASQVARSRRALWRMDTLACRERLHTRSGARARRQASGGGRPRGTHSGHPHPAPALRVQARRPRPRPRAARSYVARARPLRL